MKITDFSLALRGDCAYQLLNEDTPIPKILAHCKMTMTELAMYCAGSVREKLNEARSLTDELR